MGTSGCVQIVKLISLQGTEQRSICLGYGSSRSQQYVLLLPSSWEHSWVCKLRKNLPKGKKKEGAEAEEPASRSARVLWQWGLKGVRSLIPVALELM